MKVGIGIVTHNYPQQVEWWVYTLEKFRRRGHNFEACISFDGPAPSLSIPTVSGPGLGVAHTKNGALRYLMATDVDLIVLIEDDNQVMSWEFFEQLRRLVQYGVHHLMVAPLAEAPNTWELTGQRIQVGLETLQEYRRRREPQDTPGDITLVTREVVERCGGMDPRFVGRGHAHGEWTQRIHQTMGLVLSPFWMLETPHLRCAWTQERGMRPNQLEEVAANTALRQGLTAGSVPRPVPNIGYLVEHPPCTPVSVCMCLINRVDTLRPCLDSIAAWFAKEDTANEVVIADFGSTDCNLEEELTRRGIPHTIVRLQGYFARGRGLHAAKMAARHPTLMFLDADMLVPTTFGDVVRTFVSKGSCFFPICWSLRKTTGGWWRDTGYGMVGIHTEDYDLIGGWSLQRRRWGGEDDDLHWHCHQLGLQVHRYPVTDYQHQYHPTKTKEAHVDPKVIAEGDSWVPLAKKKTVSTPIPLLQVDVETLNAQLESQGHLEAARQSNEGFNPDMPIGISIGKEGEMTILEGHLNAAHALLSGVPTISARVLVRHPEWVELVDRLFEWYRDFKLYTAIQHPEFAGWKVCRDTEQRAKAILNLVPKGNVLILGARLGGVACALAQAGLQVTAIERSRGLAEVAKRVEQFNGDASNPILWNPAKTGGQDAVVCLSELHLGTQKGTYRQELASLMRTAPVLILEMGEGSDLRKVELGLPVGQSDIGPWLEEVTGWEARPLLKGTPPKFRQSSDDQRWLWALGESLPPLTLPVVSQGVCWDLTKGCQSRLPFMEEVLEDTSLLRVGVMVPCWQRHQLTSVVIRAIQAQTRRPDRILMVTSEDPELVALAEKLGVESIDTPNRPLSVKHATGFRHLAEDCDILINVGSDDILGPRCIERIVQCFQTPQVILAGYEDAYALEEGLIWYFQGYGLWRVDPLGTCRAVRSTAFAATGYDFGGVREDCLDKYSVEALLAACPWGRMVKLASDLHSSILAVKVEGAITSARALSERGQVPATTKDVRGFLRSRFDPETTEALMELCG